MTTKEIAMHALTGEKKFILGFRLLMAWTFLYAASHQIFNAKFSAVAFLQHTKTFHDLYAPLAQPAYDPVLTFLVGYGHLLIGLSLLVGLCVRLSSLFGVFLLLMYWTAHMDWPYIENANNFIVDYHIVYSLVLVFLINKSAGHVCGLDRKIAQWPMLQHNALLHWVCG
jgi:thiosulfate dehydrogenase [quinone] large subunit